MIYNDDSCIWLHGVDTSLPIVAAITKLFFDGTTRHFFLGENLPSHVGYMQPLGFASIVILFTWKGGSGEFESPPSRGS